MKKVFANHQEVAHVWAQQNAGQTKGRTSDRRVYFDGPTIYSYGSHFPVASFVQNEDGEGAVLVTSQRRSVSTAKHIELVWCALGYSSPFKGMPIFEVRHVPGSRMTFSADGMVHDGNCRAMQKAIESLLMQAAKSRKYTESLLQRASKSMDQMRAYMAFFKVKPIAYSAPEWFVVPAMPADLGALKAKVAKQRKQATIDKAAQREQQRIREQKEVYKQTADLAKWIAGGDVRAHFAGDTLLRLKDENVQTSRGAIFPVSHARIGLALVKRVMRAGVAWHQNGEQCRLGPYRIDRITADGTVYAGCHVVKFAAIERIAPLLDSYPKAEVAE